MFYLLKLVLRDVNIMFKMKAIVLSLSKFWNRIVLGITYVAPFAITKDQHAK